MVNVPALAAGAALVLSGGLVLCTADHALPGDALYGIKTSVNEPIRVGLSGSSDSKADVATDLAGTRLQEAGDLAVKSDLTGPLGAKLASDFQRQADAAEGQIAVLAETNGPKAAIRAKALEDLLGAQHDALASLSVNTDDAEARAQLDDLDLQVKAELDDAKRLRVAVETLVKGAQPEARAKALLTIAADAIADAKTDLSDTKAKLGINVSADADAQLAAAERLLTAGRAKLDGGAFAEASTMFAAADKLAGSAEMMADLMADVRADAATDEAEAQKIIDSIKADGSVDIDLSAGATGSGSGAGVGAGAGTGTGINVGTGTGVGGGAGVDINGQPVDLNGLPLSISL
jgi:hypothetical protein